MQGMQASLKQLLKIESINIKRIQERPSKKLRSPLNKELRRTPKPRLTLPFSNENFSPIPSHKTLQHQTISSEEAYAKAENCLSTIIDPLWKHVCRDVIHTMGAASFLKIWDSTLGEFCTQDQSMEIHCQTEETAQFIQQYDFVILGSLQLYFPALKQLRIKINSTL